MATIAEQVAHLRQAIQALYTSPDSTVRRQADTWLQGFRTSQGSWRICLSLLTAQDLFAYEQYFAANTLKTACQKFQEILSPNVLQELVPNLITLLKGCVVSQNWPVAAQLSAAIAAYAVRAPCWDPQLLPNDLLVLLSRDPFPYQLYDEGVVLAASLQVLASLGEACNSKHTAVFPGRRHLVQLSLCQSPLILPLVVSAFNSRAIMYINMALQVITEWCNLGRPPVGLEDQGAILQSICQSVVTQELCTPAAECLVALFNTSGSSVPSNVTWRGNLLRHWLGMLVYYKELAPNASREIHLAVSTVLVSAATLVLKPALQGDAHLTPHFNILSEQLLVSLSSGEDDVALSALEFWQETYLATLQRAVLEGQQQLVSQQQLLLERLTAALVSRTRLRPSTAAVATADARDLPDEVRMVRRELASTLRDIAALLGTDKMLQYETMLVQHALSRHQQMSQHLGQGSDTNLTWPDVESALYAANVVLGRCGGDYDSPCIQKLVEAGAACLSAKESCPKLSGTALTLLGGLPHWYVRHKDVLGLVTSAIQNALVSVDDKLSRNAATTICRLCQHEGLAKLLVTHHGSWVEAILQIYHKRGGMQQKTSQGDDLSTEEFLLQALCCLACAAPDSMQSHNLLVMLAKPKFEEAQRKVQLLASQQLSGRSQIEQLTNEIGQCLNVLSAVIESVPKPLSSMEAEVPGSPASSIGLEEGGELLRRRDAAGESSSSSLPSPSSSTSSSKAQLLRLISSLWAISPCCLPPQIPQELCTPSLLAAVSNFVKACLVTSGGEHLPLILQQIQVLDSLSPEMLTMPCMMSMLGACVEITSKCLSLQAQELRPSSPSAASVSEQEGLGKDGVADVVAQAHANVCRIASTAIQRACHLVLDPKTPPGDSEPLVELLNLATCCVQHLPGAVNGAMQVDNLFTVTLKACQSSDPLQCRAVLSWVPALCAAGYADTPVDYREASPTLTSPEAREATHLIRDRLDKGLGPQLVLALMMAASGQMPPDMVLPIAGCLHSLWRSVTTERFTNWLQAAVVHLAPPDAPWARYRPELKWGFLQELTHPECVQDMPRFKKVLKGFCGGKKGWKKPNRGPYDAPPMGPPAYYRR